MKTFCRKSPLPAQNGLPEESLTKSFMRIQHAAMIGTKPSTNPMKSQTRAPRGPMQPPEYESPRTWALDTVFIIKSEMVPTTPQTWYKPSMDDGYFAFASIINHQPEKNKNPASMDDKAFLLSPPSNQMQGGKFSRQEAIFVN